MLRMILCETVCTQTVPWMCVRNGGRLRTTVCSISLSPSRELLGPRHWTSQCADHSALLFYVDLSCRTCNVALFVCQDSRVDFFGFTCCRRHGTPIALRCIRCWFAICHVAHPAYGQNIALFSSLLWYPEFNRFEAENTAILQSRRFMMTSKVTGIVWIVSQYAYDWKTMLHYIIYMYHYWLLKYPR